MEDNVIKLDTDSFKAMYINHLSIPIRKYFEIGDFYQQLNFLILP